MRIIRIIPLLMLVLISRLAAQTTQPATRPVAPDRARPLGMCALFDQTAADMTVEQAMGFYHCDSNIQRRYARSECEYYIAVNKLVRLVSQSHGAEAGQRIRSLLGDSDDYSDVTVNEEGDSAAIQRPEQTPFPMIRIDGKWCFSMPDWFEMMDHETLTGMRLHFESTADHADDIRQNIQSGKLTTLAQIEAAVEQAAEEN